jgi:hypothetical protein
MSVCLLQEQVASVSTRLKALQADVDRQSRAIDALRINYHHAGNIAEQENRGQNDNTPCGPPASILSGKGIALQCSRLQEALSKLEKLRADRIRVLESISDAPAQRV